MPFWSHISPLPPSHLLLCSSCFCEAVSRLLDAVNTWKHIQKRRVHDTSSALPPALASSLSSAALLPRGSPLPPRIAQSMGVIPSQPVDTTPAGVPQASAAVPSFPSPGEKSRAVTANATRSNSSESSADTAKPGEANRLSSSDPPIGVARRSLSFGPSLGRNSQNSHARLSTPILSPPQKTPETTSAEDVGVTPTDTHANNSAPLSGSHRPAAPSDSLWSTVGTASLGSLFPFLAY